MTASKVLAVDPAWANKAHIVTVPAFTQEWFTACGMDVHGDAVPARTVDVDRRCARAGCRSRWPALLRACS